MGTLSSPGAQSRGLFVPQWEGILSKKSLHREATRVGRQMLKERLDIKQRRQDEDLERRVQLLQRWRRRHSNTADAHPPSIFDILDEMTR